MGSIEKFISPFIARQFPSFYLEEGPNFIAFIKAYYEWLEQSNGAVYQARSLLEYSDIDSTTDRFIDYFRSQYVYSIPKDTAIDKRLMIKHIQDLYRTKGSPRAAQLLFRLLYNEDIDVYIPNEFIFKLSDNTWKVPKYLELSTRSSIESLINTRVQTIGNTASAIVESINLKVIDGKIITIAEISNVTGSFKVGDRIYATSNTIVEDVNAPKITGSLGSIIVSDGGLNFSVGDVLDVTGTGVEGRVRVTSTSNNFTGAVSFNILDGGSGYTTNAEVTVLKTLQLDIFNLQGTISTGDIVQEPISSANAEVYFANNTFARLFNFSNNFAFAEGLSIVGPFGNATIGRAYGGTGSGASFRVGSISNKETISFYTTIIEDYVNLNLDRVSNTFQINVSSISGTFSNGDTVTGSANIIYLVGSTSSSNSISNGESLSNSSLGISNLVVTRSDGTLIFCTGPDASLNNANLVSGTILISNTTSSVFQLSAAAVKETITGEAIISSSNSTVLILSSVNGYFVETSTITDSNSAATAAIVDVVRLSDWQIEGSIASLDNLDTSIQDSLEYREIEVGTIESLTSIAPGLQYFTRPVVIVTEPEIVELNLFDVQGKKIGNNAVIESEISGGNGTITAVDILNSGYFYNEGESIVLSSPDRDIIALGSVALNGEGKGEGRWLNRKSFISDVMKIHDNTFYQDYSYQIIAQKMLSSYEDVVRALIHQSGIALYGTYRANLLSETELDVVSESSLTQETV